MPRLFTLLFFLICFLLLFFSFLSSAATTQHLQRRQVNTTESLLSLASTSTAPVNNTTSSTPPMSRRERKRAKKGPSMRDVIRNQTSTRGKIKAGFKHAANKTKHWATHGGAPIIGLTAGAIVGVAVGAATSELSPMVSGALGGASGAITTAVVTAKLKEIGQGHKLVEIPKNATELGQWVVKHGKRILIAGSTGAIGGAIGAKIGSVVYGLVARKSTEQVASKAGQAVASSGGNRLSASLQGAWRKVSSKELPFKVPFVKERTVGGVAAKSAGQVTSASTFAVVSGATQPGAAVLVNDAAAVMKLPNVPITP